MKQGFEIPNIDEIKIHMQAKKPEWPLKFIEFYADKFWNKYQSQGWKLSNNVAMKDWRAAFAANWQNIKYKEDFDLLNSMIIKKRPQESKIVLGDGSGKNIQYLDEVLADYKKHPAYISKETLASCCDWLKQNGFMKLTEEEKGIVLKKFNQDKVAGRAIAVQFVFDRMAMRLLTFSEMMANV